MGIIVSSSEGPGKPFTFAHELVRQTILADISVPRRQQLHAKAGAEIERMNPKSVKEHAGEISYHLLKAGSFASRDALVRSLTEAGSAALEAAAFGEARVHFQSALSRLDQTDSRQRARLLERIGAAYWGLERREEAIFHLREALEIYIDLDDRQMIATAYADLTDALTWTAHNHEAIEVGRHGLAFVETSTGPDRVRLLAATAEALANTANYEPAEQTLSEAFGLSSKLSDPKLESRLLTARILLNNRSFRLKEVADDGLRSEALPLTGPKAPWDRIIRLTVLAEALSYLGRLEEAVRIADKLEPPAKKVAHGLAVANCHWIRAWSQFGREPDLLKLQTDLQEASKPEHIQHSPYWEFDSHLLLGIVDFYRGNWDDAMAHYRACSRLGTVLSLESIGSGLVFRQLAYAGDRDRALAILNEKGAFLPLRGGGHNAIGSWWMLVLVIEGLFILGEQAQAGELYPLVLELLDREVVLFYCSYRFTQTIAGIAAAGAGQFEAAECHFRTAFEQAESLPFHFEKVEINRFRAMILINRGRPGDREQARSLLNQALATYEHYGMRRHVEITRTLLV
jgi:tetratricopeptide (TPR) repeat protein